MRDLKGGYQKVKRRGKSIPVEGSNGVEAQGQEGTWSSPGMERGPMGCNRVSKEESLQERLEKWEEKT